MVLPRSPRRRRRLLALAVVLAFLAGVAGIALLLPGGPPQDVEVFHGRADVLQPSFDHVSRAERLAITGSLRRFVSDGLGRRDLAAAWELSGPRLRGSTPHATWLAGRVPFIRYGARPFGPDAWRVVDATPGHVVLDLFVQPARGAKQGPATFTFDVHRAGERWRIESVYASVLFSREHERPHVIASNDFAAPGAGDARKGDARLSSTWLLAPVALFGVLLALLALSIRRSRRRA